MESGCNSGGVRVLQHLLDASGLASNALDCLPLRIGSLQSAQRHESLVKHFPQAMYYRAVEFNGLQLLIHVKLYGEVPLLTKRVYG